MEDNAFISPEALFLTTEWRRILSGDLCGRNLVGFVVDEAHCVKKWYMKMINRSSSMCICHYDI